MAEYLAEKPATFTFGLAGRNLEKLEAVKDSLIALNSQHKVCIGLYVNRETNVQDITLLVADSNDAKSLDSMVKRCKVIISTVGPYHKYGIPLGMQFSYLLYLCSRLSQR